MEVWQTKTHYCAGGYLCLHFLAFHAIMNRARKHTNPTHYRPDPQIGHVVGYLNLPGGSISRVGGPFAYIPNPEFYDIFGKMRIPYSFKWGSFRGAPNSESFRCRHKSQHIEGRSWETPIDPKLVGRMETVCHIWVIPITYRYELPK